MRLHTLLIGLVWFAATSHAQPATLPPIVSADWLIEHQQDPDMVVLQVAFSRRDYAREHIPGSRFMWFSWLSPSTPDGSTEMASAAEAEQVLENLGVTDRSKIIVAYSSNSIPTTARTIYALLYFGFEGRVALLDGGLEAWKRAGGPVTKAVPIVQRSSLDITVRPEFLASADVVRDHLADPGMTIVDARAKSFFDGGGGGARPGHIKGAVSLPYTLLVDSLNRFKPRESLERTFHDAGVKPSSAIVAYCHVGQQATVVLHAARLLGYPVRLYDGSYEEWSALDEAAYPVEPTPVIEQP